jgi:dipeptidyl aminopeptidase/acylaminoacyl peptidase
VGSIDGDAVTPLALGTRPAWSPDARQIAFEFQGLKFIDADGSEAKAVGNGAHPAWSPDGTQLLFTDYSDLWGIARVDIDGSNAISLIGHATLGGNGWDTGVSMPAWSPDGQQIAFEFAGMAYVMNADGSEPRRMTNASYEFGYGYSERNPAWSPDGSTIAFLTFFDAGGWGSWIGLATVDPEDGVPASVDSGMPAVAFEHRPAWSPDGSTIAFTATAEAVTGIWTVPAGGGEVELLIPDAFDPAWGADGRIAFVSYVHCANEWGIVVWNENANGPFGSAFASGLYLGTEPASDLVVRVGGTVEWLNRSLVEPYTSHIVSTSHPPGGLPFDSGELGSGDTFSFVPNVEGTWTYMDAVNGLTGMLTADSTATRPGFNCN